MIASDDVDWCKSTFGQFSDVVFSVDSKSPFSVTHQPTFDLAVLSLCDHSIFRFVIKIFIDVFLLLVY